MRGSSNWRVAVVVCSVVLQLAGTARAEDGLRLADYLDALNGDNYSILYSSDLVSDGMRLASAPQAPSASDLRALLEPFGLTLRADAGQRWLIIAVAHAAAPPVAGPPPPAMPAIPEIVVSSSLHRLAYAAPAERSHLDREQLATAPATVDEAVRQTQQLPGVASGGVSTRGHVRGGEETEVLFLFDGLRLYEPYHLKDFQAIASVISANAIGGIDFYTGAYPARYGDRMSGVMSIELREPEQPVETELAVSFFNASLLSLGRFGAGERGDWLLSARRGNLDLVLDVIDPQFGSPDYRDYLAHVAWDFNPRAVLSANFLASNDKLRLADPDRGETATASYNNQVGWLKWRADWTDSLTSDTILAVSDITNRRRGTVDLPGIVAGELVERREFSAVELRQDWSWLPGDAWMLRFGFNGKRLEADYSLASRQSIAAPFDTVLDNRPTTVRDIELDPSGAQYAAYTELRWRALEHWTFDVGLRWDQQTYTTAADDTQYSPRVAMLFAPNARFELRAGWGQYYQAQEINELQVSDGVTEFSPAQQAEHVVLSLTFFVTPTIEASFAAYQKQFHKPRPRFENAFNSLTLLPELQFDRVLVDPLAAKALGAELTVRRGTAEDDLWWWLGYSWSRAEDSWADATLRRSWDQAHTLKGGLGWRRGAWRIGVSGEAHTGWPQTALSGETGPGGELTLSVAARNATRYPLYHALNLRISRRFDVRRGDLNVFLDVSNLYNRANRCCVEYSLSPQGDLERRNKHWLPLLPSLGLNWRF